MISAIVRSTYLGANWADVVTLFGALIGGLFALWQWRRACRVSRAEHLNAVLGRYDTQKMTNLFYRFVNDVAYGGDGSEEFYLGHLRFKKVREGTENELDMERDIDSMLSLFTQICHEHECAAISRGEFAFFCYQIRRTLAHGQIKQYLFDLAEYCGRHDVAFPFLALVREGINVDREHYGRVLDFVDRGMFTKVVNKMKEVFL